MSAVATWGGDAMPAGVAIEPASTSSYFMTRQRAEEVTDRARTSWRIAMAGASGVVAALSEALAGNAHQVLGFASWHEYVEHIIDGDLRDLRLSGSEEAVAVRAALARSLRDDARLTYRQIRDRLDVSLGTIRNDIGDASIGGDVVDLHPEALPAPTGRVYEQAYEWLHRQADRGLTRLELGSETGWRDGRCGGVLEYLVDKGWAIKAEAWRLEQRVFLAVDRDVAAN